MYSRSRGYLPHIEDHQRTYFVTFRTADSLPQSVLNQFQEECKLRKVKDPSNSEQANRDYHRKIEKYLDAGYGECFLRHPMVAEILQRILCSENGVTYQMHAWCIMPNHVHLLFSPIKPSEEQLGLLLRYWKGKSAHEINQLLERKGAFWQREYFDRLIRSVDHFVYAARYILNNPVKAGLCSQWNDWRWTGCSEVVKAAIDLGEV